MATMTKTRRALFPLRHEVDMKNKRKVLEKKSFSPMKRRIMYKHSLVVETTTIVRKIYSPLKENVDTSGGSNSYRNDTVSNEAAPSTQISQSEIILKTKLLMFLMKMALEKGYAFFWKSKINVLDYVDKTISDFVIRFKNLHCENNEFYRFINMRYEKEESDKSVKKYKELTMDGILSENDDYSLRKCFDSFCDAIKFVKHFTGNEKQIDDFVFITNIEFDAKDEWKEFCTCERMSSENDKFLFINDTINIIKFKNSDNLKKRLRINPDDEIMFMLFLEKFKFITNYPSEKYLNMWIKWELKETFHLLRDYLIEPTSKKLNAFHKKHFNKKIDGFLELEKEKARGKELFKEMKKDIDTIVLNEMTENNPHQLNEYDVEFEKKFRTACIKASERLVLLVSAKCTQLSAIKILQELNELQQKNNVDFMFVQKQRLQLYRGDEIIGNAFCADKGPKRLVIECEYGNEQHFDNIVQLCKEWQMRVPEKQIILIIDEEYKFENSIQREFKIIEDKHISFEHLTKAAQKKLKESKNLLDVKDDELKSKLNPICLWRLLTQNIFFR